MLCDEIIVASRAYCDEIFSLKVYRGYVVSRNFEIECARCGTHVISYRKEGSGALLRVYLDRIIDFPEEGFLTGKQVSTKSSPLVCPQCREYIGRPNNKANRQAWRLVPGSFRKKGK